LKLLLLDADVIIDLLSLGCLELLIIKKKVFVASTVIDEVKSYWKNKSKVNINFRENFVNTNKIIELSANADEIKQLVYSKMPNIMPF
jgi:hypothetical protein